ncbi:hypothetical protein GCM10007989_08280 [Devosia pacifica]|uniref:Uncharacterized protein n=1 Tax=Devosia pacifica TaxID=1335967 RepID=A0A918VQ16_9HYPH|nr:hypothetical protein [Devosia pacifica]GHA15806.1 hypothetical protein GCM10007989_08280 [Devosia pacifica]
MHLLNPAMPVLQGKLTADQGFGALGVRHIAAPADYGMSEACDAAIQPSFLPEA